jgi:mono/diheme cytochrome c family protein
MGGASKARKRLVWRSCTIAITSLGAALAIASTGAASGDRLSIGSGVSSTAQSDTEKTVTAGVYSKEQAAAGKKLYSDICSSCHLENLGGDTMSPALAGDAFMSQWENKNLRAIYSRIISTMPTDAPGTLPEKTVVDIVAYLLEANGFPAGSAALETANEMNTIRVTRAK